MALLAGRPLYWNSRTLPTFTERIFPPVLIRGFTPCMSWSTVPGAVRQNDRGIRKEGCISDPGVLRSAARCHFHRGTPSSRRYVDDHPSLSRSDRPQGTEPRGARGPSEMPVLLPCPGQLYLADRSFFWTVNPSVPS